MSVTFYGDLHLGFSVIMSIHYSLKSDAEIAVEFRIHYDINYPQLLTKLKRRRAIYLRSDEKINKSTFLIVKW